MAAHILIGINQVIQMLETDENAARLHINTGLNYSCWTEDDPSEWTEEGGIWHHLNDWLNGELPTANLLHYLNYARIRFTEIWESYGRPATREDWHTARFG